MAEKRGSGLRATAESMAAKQRDISVSEFFAKNRHLLGFDNPRKALLTTVKEAVDNSLDACEEAGILPDIAVLIEELEPADGAKPTASKAAERTEDAADAADGKPKRKRGAGQGSRYRVTVMDNGPGIVRKQVENIFGRLLYGSKFHRLKMSRGQQGIGISAAGMYGLITTGRPMVIHTKPSTRAAAHHIELAMNTKTNRAEVTEDLETDDFPPRRVVELAGAAQGTPLIDTARFPTGTSVSIELEGRYQKGRGSVDEFLELTAIANPHARIVFVPPTKVSDDDEDTTGPELSFTSANTHPTATDAAAAVTRTEDIGGVIVFPRGVEELPKETQEIQPHPKGIELGILIQMLREAEQEDKSIPLFRFLQERFSRVSPSTAASLCKAVGLTSRSRVSEVDHALAERLYRELTEAKLPPPPTDCLAPIGVKQLLAGLLKGVKAEFYAASSRDAAVYRGRPFQIEAALAFGGDLPSDESARVIRFANRVPLLYQQSACSSFKSVLETNWRNYDLQQPRGAAPVGPLVVMIHMASVWVPFTSESKEAIADYDEIRKEMKLALMECGRKLGTYLRKRAKMRREGERRDVFSRYIGEIAKAIEAINGSDASRVYDALMEQARKRTAVADQTLDDEGRVIKSDDPDDDDGVIILAPDGSGDGPGGSGGTGTGSGVFDQSATERAMLEVASRSRSTGADRPKRNPKKPGAGKQTKPSRAASAVEAKQTNTPKPAPTTTRAPDTDALPRPAKPRLRLVNGKPVPVADLDPGLFAGSASKGV